MQDYALAHAEQIDTFLAVVLTIIKSLNGKAIAERLDRIMKRDAMIAPVGRGLRVIPFEFVMLNMYGVSVVSSREPRVDAVVAVDGARMDKRLTDQRLRQAGGGAYPD